MFFFDIANENEEVRALITSGILCLQLCECFNFIININSLKEKNFQFVAVRLVFSDEYIDKLLSLRLHEVSFVHFPICFHVHRISHRFFFVSIAFLELSFPSNRFSVRFSLSGIFIDTISFWIIQNASKCQWSSFLVKSFLFPDPPGCVIDMKEWFMPNREFFLHLSNDLIFNRSLFLWFCRFFFTAIFLSLNQPILRPSAICW